MTIITTSILNGTIDLFELDENYIVLPDVVLVTSNTAFGVSVFITNVSSTVTSLTVLGTIASSYVPIGIFHGANHSIAIGTQGNVVADSAGGAPGIYLGVAGCRVDNAGQIIGGVLGIQATAAETVIVNSGQVTGAAGGIAISGNGSHVTNTGLITGSRGEDGAGFYGVELSSGTGLTLFNDGTILGDGNSISSAVVLSNGGSATITNTGLLASSSGDGVLVGANSTVMLTNTGTISGNRSFVGGTEGDTVINRGTMTGDVVFGSGNDLFDGIGGTVTGRVIGGSGNDTYILSDTTTAIVEIASGGTDELRAAQDASLENLAQIENLTLIGTAGQGTGNAAANVVTGNGLDNRLDGLGGNDTLAGRAGHDWLRGNAGNDNLSGGDGEDTLFGGAGSDVMNGGADSDTFIYRRTSDSGTSNNTRDVIQNFAAGEDLIDLSAIDADTATAGNQVFVWLGTASFTVGMAGQLRFNAATGDLLADVTGDGVADFAVRLNGVTVFAGGDIVL